MPRCEGPRDRNKSGVSSHTHLADAAGQRVDDKVRDGLVLAPLEDGLGLSDDRTVRKLDSVPAGVSASGTLAHLKKSMGVAVETRYS